MRRGPVVTHVELLHGDTFPQARRAHELALEIGASVVSVDAGGVGATAAAWMRQQEHVPYELREVLFGQPPAGAKTRYGPRTTNGQQFARRNAQLGWGVRLHLVVDAPDLAITPDAPHNLTMGRYLGQLGQPTWDHDASMRVRVDKGTPSPDAYDGTVLAFAEESRRGLRVPGARSAARILTVRANR